MTEQLNTTKQQEQRTNPKAKAGIERLRNREKFSENTRGGVTKNGVCDLPRKKVILVLQFPFNPL